MLKPRQPDTKGDTKITVQKLEAARRQLEAAIGFYFHGGDPVSIHTLTAAAYMVVRDVNESRGGPMMLKDAWLFLADPDDRAEFLKHINGPDNFFEHAEGDPDGELSFDPRWTEVLISDASRAYMRLTGERPPLRAGQGRVARCCQGSSAQGLARAEVKRSGRIFRKVARRFEVLRAAGELRSVAPLSAPASHSARARPCAELPKWTADDALVAP